MLYGQVPVFNELRFSVLKGQSLAIVGPSGSGKTSLLLCLAGLIPPAAGSVWIESRSLWDLSKRDRTKLRRERIGFVEQGSGLVPELSLCENVGLPLRLTGESAASATAAARLSLNRFGIGDLAQRFPDQVSGGEAQRAAIARAMIHRPAVVLADEPTGALDKSNRAIVLAALLDAAKDAGAAVVVVTHDSYVADAADLQIQMAPRTSGTRV